MNYTKPTEQEPLLFFINTFLKGGIKKLKSSFIDSWAIAKEQDKRIHIDEDNEYVIHYLVQDDKGVDIPTHEYFQDHLNNIILTATKEAESRLRERIGVILLKKESILAFLIEQRNILSTILENEKDAVDKYAALSYSIRELNAILGELAVKYDVKDFFPDEESVLESTKTVYVILGYLGKTIGEGQKIMSDTEYSRLINAVLHMIHSEEEVSLEKKFSKLLISNGLLYFTFYVLYKELGKSVLRKIFVRFITNSFIQNDITEDALKSKFSRHPGYLPPGEWLPDIIRNYALKASRN